MSYPTIHRIVKYKLRSKLKIPRPAHEKQAPGVVKAFKRFLPARIEGIIQQLKNKWVEKPNIAYWCQDETRLGLRTSSGKKITKASVLEGRSFRAEGAEACDSETESNGSIAFAEGL